MYTAAQVLLRSYKPKANWDGKPLIWQCLVLLTSGSITEEKLSWGV